MQTISYMSSVIGVALFRDDDRRKKGVATSCADAMAPCPDTDLVCELLVSASMDALLQLVHERSPARERDTLVEMLDHIAIWCHRAAAAVRDEPSYAITLFYERTRLRYRLGTPHGAAAAGAFFLDGLPTALAVAGSGLAGSGDYKGMPQPTEAQMTFGLALEDRHDTIRRLEASTPGGLEEVRMARQMQLMAGVGPVPPVTPLIFLARTRVFFARLCAARDASWFVTCSNRACKRLFMRNCRAKPNGAAESSPSSMRPMDSDYWEHIAPSPIYERDASRFCCESCAEGWWAQCRAYGNVWAALFESRGQVADALDEADDGRLLAHAMDRNSRLAHALKATRHRRPTMLFRRDRRVIVKTLIARANVDAGVLFCRQIVMSCPSLQRSPRASASTVVSRVRALYRARQLGYPVSSIDEPCRYLRAVKVHIAGIIAPP